MATLWRLLRWLEEQPLQDKESLTKLAHSGWFFGPDMPVAAIPRLGSAVEFMPDEVDIAVAQYIQCHLDQIEAALIGTYPLRAHLLQEGFRSHRESRYALSIPLFLSQADGVFHDRFGKFLFSKRGNAAVGAFSSEVRGRFFQAVLHPLTISTSLWVHTNSFDDTFEGLNRHQVIHGMKVDYDTELNSLKAISLLDNLAWVLNRQSDETLTRSRWSGYDSPVARTSGHHERRRRSRPGYQSSPRAAPSRSWR